MLTDSQLAKTVSKVEYKEHTECRVCGSDRLTPYLDLGLLPLSNNLASSPTDPIHDQRYPLRVLLCEGCGLSQLSIVIPPDVLFGHYVYRSAIAAGYRTHCREMAIELRERYKLGFETFHIDIAGNDGTLLREFKAVVGNTRALNVDPAQNLVPFGVSGVAGCDADGIQYFTEFWGLRAAKHLRSTYWPLADLITATNVFAHVDDVHEFLEAVRMTLKPTGVLVMEFPYLVDFIEGGEFDTIYFEHLSYMSIYPLTLLCQRIGLTVMSVSRQQIHGGSVRVTIGYGKQDSTVAEFVKVERDRYANITRYYEFAETVGVTIHEFREGLRGLKNVAGFAASAKGNTLLNCAGIGPEMMRYIVDETPEKIAKYSPGVKIPIVSLEVLRHDPPDYLVILSWNFSSEIVDKCRKFGYRGKFVIPIPEFKIID